jgi:hypothetical protein
MAFQCEKCNFITSNKFNYKQHLKTAKHLECKRVKRNTKYSCSVCNKSYVYKAALVKHNEKCKPNALLEQENITLKEQLIDMKQMIKDMIPRIGNQNKISINVYLEEKCRDAINLDDFLEKINITVDDLLNTREVGYSQGISNIFLRGLNEIETTKRPIHCSDKKRLQFYIKNEDKWNRDNGNKIENAINHISCKQISLIKEWEKQNINWEKSERKVREYLEIIKQVMGGTNDNEIEKYNKHIVKYIGENTFFKQ